MSPDLKPNLKQARLAVLSMFFINGTVLASWVANIPLVKERLSLSEATLGFTLLAMAAGAILAMPLTGYLIPRYGSRTMTRLTGVLFCLVLPLPILAPSLPLLVVALFFFGAFQGGMDVAMNAQAVAVENALDKPIMSSFHGWFSLGGLTGASLGGLLFSVGISPTVHAFSAMLMLSVATLLMMRQLYEAGDEQGGHHTFALPTGPLLGLGLLAFFVLVGEGSVADWSAVYLRDVLGTSAGLAATGYAAFSLTMALGRFLGDGWVKRFGAVPLARASATLAASGLGIALLIGHPVAALLGFGCVGLGLANLIPILFGAAGRTPGVNPGTGIAAVSSAGYFGFLAGPPLIGLAAEVVSLSGALYIVVVFIAVTAVFAHVVRRKGEPVRGSSAVEELA